MPDNDGGDNDVDDDGNDDDIYHVPSKEGLQGPWI